MHIIHKPCTLPTSLQAGAYVDFPLYEHCLCNCCAMLHGYYSQCSGSTCPEFSCHHCQLIIRLRKEMFHGSAIPLNCEILNTYTCSVSTCGDSKSTTWGRAGKVETRRPSYISLRGLSPSTASIGNQGNTTTWGGKAKLQRALVGVGIWVGSEYI